MKIKILENYDVEIGKQIRELLIDLSRKHKDKGELSEDYMKEIVASPYHDIIVAVDDNEEIVGMALLSMIANIHKKKAYLEDFVTSEACRGQGIGSLLWEEMLKWAKAHDCEELVFTSGYDREAAHRFYEKHGAAIYDTAFYRKEV